MRDVTSKTYLVTVGRIGSKPGKIYWSEATPTQVLEFWGETTTIYPPLKQKGRKKGRTRGTRHAHCRNLCE